MGVVSLKEGRSEMRLRAKNSVFQSCRYCFIGGGLYRVDSDEGTYYVCEKHREEKNFNILPIEEVEEEFFQKIGVIQKVLNYIKGD